MNDKKNIDRLFQERFKDFESVPNEKIWNNIHDALHEKKKRKIIPLWWKLSGIAAGFVLAFLAFNTLSNPIIVEPSVVVAPKEVKNATPNKLNSTPSTESTITIESEAISLDKNNLNANETPLNPSKSTETIIAIENTKPSKSENDSKGILNQNFKKNRGKATTIYTKKNKNEATENTAVANNSMENLNQDLIENKTASKGRIEFDSSAENSSKKNKFVNNSDVINTAIQSENTIEKLNKTTKDIDSTATVLASETNPLEEILKKKNEKGEEVLATAKLNRWQVTTNVAPVYFNSATNGSPIETQFEENSKTYENNLSVGIGVQYAVNKKLTVRTGVNKLTLGYATNDVVFFGALNSPGFSTLNADDSMSHMEVFSANNADGLRPFEDNSQNMESGILNQTMGYYEVPMELSYALINRKFGIHVIGGLSTLFLNENTISVQSSTTTMGLGKANNLNNIHFSSNIGLGFNYEFWKSFEAHFEPTFKYQFNTFSGNDGNFKPYFVGLYTGVSFKF
ncbi:hypothetical protein [Flavobacterium sp. SM2513]|uniref:hypothetical protein n=1 Tax=Flavobacterium sp. SM2513 TaxID=3424766 RepID=UPI003D7FFE06